MQPSQGRTQRMNATDVGALHKPCNFSHLKSSVSFHAFQSIGNSDELEADNQHDTSPNHAQTTISNYKNSMKHAIDETY
jgi:hypothetical protein